MTCAKLGYSSEFTALAATVHLRRPAGTKTEARAYLCRYCSQWHLTSAPTAWVDSRVYDTRKVRGVR